MVTLENPFRPLAKKSNSHEVQENGSSVAPGSSRQSVNQSHVDVDNQRSNLNSQRYPNSVAERGVDLWRGQSCRRFQSGQRGNFPSNGFAAHGQFPQQQNHFRGGQRGRYRGNHHGAPRGAAFHTTRGNAAVNPLPGLFRTPPQSYYCESCDIEFRNQEKLDHHVQEHVKCPKCDFIGVIDSIEEHFELVHLTVLKNRSKPVETEEDLKAWRAERRLRFPRPKSKSTQRLSSTNELQTAAVRNTGDLSDGEIVDEEMPLRVSSCGASTLTSLFGCYGADDSDSDGPEEMPITCDASSESRADQESTDGGPIDPPSPHSAPALAVDAHDLTPSLNEDLEITRKLPDRRPLPSASVSRQRPQPYRLPPKRKPRTLYEKLVAQDIEKDNDRLLQCIAHICSSDFLGVGAGSR